MITILIDDRSFVFSESTLMKNPDFIITKIIKKVVNPTDLVNNIIEVIDVDTFRIDMSPENFAVIARELRRKAQLSESNKSYDAIIESVLFQSQLVQSPQVPTNNLSGGSTEGYFQSPSSKGIKLNTPNVEVDLMKILDTPQNNLRHNPLETTNTKSTIFRHKSPINMPRNHDTIESDNYVSLQSTTDKQSISLFDFTSVGGGNNTKSSELNKLTETTNDNTNISDSSISTSTSTKDQHIESDFFRLIKSNENKENNENKRIFKSRKIELNTTTEST